MVYWLQSIDKGYVTMINFRNDYSAGAHPAVMDALLRSNMDITPGYGMDTYCTAAADKIRALCAAPDAEVHFFVGGTQVNKTALGAFLRPYEAVIAADTGHISVHEAGAIEQDGHKIIHCSTPDGKLTGDIIRTVVRSHNGEMMVSPRLVYISNTTEVGTVYSLRELQDLSRVCRELGLLLYCDGARLGSAMTVTGADTTFADYAACCDAFTIGGTKNGLLFGEALIVTNHSVTSGFRSCMKQQGAILSKDRLLGVQFDAILTDDLYLKLADHANRLAEYVAEGLAALGVPMLTQSPSNQLFPIFSNDVVEALRKEVAFEVIEPVGDDRTCIRFVTSWETTREDADALLAAIKRLCA